MIFYLLLTIEVFELAVLSLQLFVCTMNSNLFVFNKIVKIKYNINYEELSKLKFTDASLLIKYVKKLAEKDGFKLHNKDSQNSNRIRFYCYQSKSAKSPRPSCPFHLNFNKSMNCEFYRLSSSSTFEHNHEINQTSEFDQEIKEEVCLLKSVGISNFHIITTISKKFGVSISIQDIKAYQKTNPNVSGSQIDPLIS